MPPLPPVAYDLTAEQQKALAGVTPALVHPYVVKAAAAGSFTILNLFDTLSWFRGAADWTPWRAFLCAVYGLPMTEREFAIFRECTGRDTAPTQQASEVWMPVGRRARKSAVVALMALWHGAYKDYSGIVAPGERPAIPILAKNKYEAKQIKTYVEAILKDPKLSYLLAGEATAEEVALSAGVDLVIKAAAITSGRSRTTPFAALEEVAFFQSEGSANPDEEIVRGILPGMATVPGAMLCGLSSPYARRGILYEKWSKHYGKDGDPVLVWQAPTLRMHDTPQMRVFIAKAYEDDPVGAAAEYGAKFRSDIEDYTTLEALMAVTVAGRKDMAHIPGMKYRAFIDVSGGSSDSFTLSIAHYDHAKGKAVQDCLHEWMAPFDPEEIVDEACQVLQRYQLAEAWGDKYAGEWPRSRFKHHKVNYHKTDETRSDIYRNFLPIINGKKVELLDLPRTLRQIQRLDRFVSRGGKDTIDHRPGEHDDLANATAGACLAADRLGYGKKGPPVKEPEPETTREYFNARVRSLVKPKARPLGNSYRR